MSLLFNVGTEYFELIVDLTDYLGRVLSSIKQDIES